MRIAQGVLQVYAAGMIAMSILISDVKGDKEFDMKARIMTVVLWPGLAIAILQNPPADKDVEI